MTNKLILFFVLFLTFFPLIIDASKVSMPFQIELIPSEPVAKSGNVRINLNITPKYECSNVDVSITTFGNLTLSTEQRWTTRCSINETLKYDLTVNIPDRDTTGFEVKVESGNVWHHAFLYFVTTGKETKYFPGNPRFSYSNPPAKQLIKANMMKITSSDVKTEYDTLMYACSMGFKTTNLTIPDASLAPAHDSTEKRVTGSVQVSTDENIEGEIKRHPNRSPKEVMHCITDMNALYSDDKHLGKQHKIFLPKETIGNSSREEHNIQDRSNVFFDDFSGSHPGSWYIGHDGGGGNYSWAWPNSFAYCYADPTGSQYYYPDDLHVYMERRNVNLSAYGEAMLSFYKIVDTEAGYDGFTVNVKDQWGSWHCVYTESGITDPLSWEYLEINLDQFAGQTGLYIQFRFDSDGSVSGSPYEGIYIDNVSLDAWTVSMPNLAPYQPTGWDYKIVPSSVTGTNSLNTLYGNQATYIDWSMINNGSANITQTFYIRLYIDNIYITQWSANSLQSSHYATVEDYSRTLTSGYHTLKIIIDYYDDIDESDETDNEYSREFYWVSTSLPNLEPYTPAGWTYPIIPSSVQGSHTVSTLYANQDTYIDWAVENNGDASINQTFCNRLYIDNVFISEWVANGLQMNQYIHVDDYICNLSSGYHTLKIITDYWDDIDESDENDNEYSRQFYWEAAGTIQVMGRLRYHDYNPYQIRDARHVKVELWDADSTSSHDLLWSGWTDSQGYFVSSAVSNNEPLQGTQDIYVKIFAQNEACNVKNGVAGMTYFVQTPTINNVSHGFYDYGILVPSGDNDNFHDGAFFIADTILQGYENWSQFLPNNLGDVVVVHPDDPVAPTGTYYNNNLNYIMICGNNNPSQAYPDTFDEDIILHEYGHRIEDVCNFFDDSEGGGHAWTDTISLGLAASEAFAHYFSCLVRDNCLEYDWWLNSNGYYTNNFSVNLENGDCLANQSYVSNANSIGNLCEGSVAGMLWDLHDMIDDDQDDDGVGDSYDNGNQYVLNTLVNRTVNGHKPDNIDEFWNAWFSSPSYGSDHELWAIWFEHGDNNDYAIPNTPEITFCSHAIGLISSDDTVDLNWSCSDNGFSGIAGFSYEWSQSSTTIPNNTSQGASTSTTSYSLSNSNNWYFHLKAVDQAGNWSNTRHHGPFYIDDAPPTTPIIVSCSHNPEEWDNDDTISIEWSSSDYRLEINESGLETSTNSQASLDTRSVAGYSYEWSQTPSTEPNNISQGSSTSTYSPSLANGNNWYFHVKAVDLAGNWSGIRHYGPFYIDDISPGIPSITSCSHDLEDWDNDDNIAITWSFSDTGGSGLGGYSHEWSQSSTTIPNNTSQGSTNATTSPSLTNAQNWYFHVKSIDQAGNWGETRHHGPFYIDDASPSGSVSINNGNPATSSLIVTLNLHAQDNGSGVDKMCFSNNGSVWSNWINYNTISVNWDISLYGGNEQNGIKTVYAKFRDHAGNISSVVSDQIDYAGSIATPDNVSISVASDIIHLSWTEVTSANSYKVFTSIYPNDLPFENEVTELGWFEYIGNQVYWHSSVFNDEKMFFSIRASSDQPPIRPR